MLAIRTTHRKQLVAAPAAEEIDRRTCQCPKLGNATIAAGPRAASRAYGARMAGLLQGLAEDHVIEGLVG